MYSIFHHRIFLAAAILLGLWDAAPAQWKNLAPNLVRAYQYYGAMHYKDGIIWAGSEDLWSSKDTGKTWTRVSSFFIPGDVIRDIAFSDRNIGVICTNGGGIYITRDGGATWNMSWPTPYCWRIAIHRSSNTMYAAVGKDTLNVLTSFDEGVTWVPQTITGRVQTMSIGVDGSVFVLSYEGTAAKVSASTNRGATWSKASGPVDFDSYSLEVDSCDNRQFYIINEDYASSNNGLSEIYSSTDAGATWRVSFSQPVNYLAGSAASSKNVQYVPTLSNGVLRSTDRGRSWKNIGGPGNVADSRNICAINDNTIFVLDPFGSIWATFNSGADSLPAFPSTGALTVVPDTLFHQDTVYVCDTTIRRFVKIDRVGCAPYIENVELSGPDAARYVIASRMSDSIGLDFTPVGAGAYQAMLLLNRTDGTQDTVILHGVSGQTPFVITPSPQSLFDLDSIVTCDSLRKTVYIGISGCPGQELTSFTIAGSHPADYSIIGNARDTLTGYDSVVVQFAPKATGARDAFLVLMRPNGSRLQIPLNGVGLGRNLLAIVTEDRYTDTIGGSVNIPITITGLDVPRDIDLTLRWDSGLEYVGSFAPNGVQLDLPAEQWPQRSKLRIQNASSATLAGYASFLVFADSSQKQRVWFDSISVLNVSPCEYILPEIALSIVTPPSGCGIPILTKFLRTGEIPEFTIRPNPAGHIIVVECSDIASALRLEVSDELGRKQLVQEYGTKLQPLSLDVSRLPNGVYFLRIEAGGFIATKPFMIDR